MQQVHFCVLQRVCDDATLNRLRNGVGPPRFLDDGVYLLKPPSSIMPAPFSRQSVTKRKCEDLGASGPDCIRLSSAQETRRQAGNLPRARRMRMKFMPSGAAARHRSEHGGPTRSCRGIRRRPRAQEISILVPEERVRAIVLRSIPGSATLRRVGLDKPTSARAGEQAAAAAPPRSRAAVDAGADARPVNGRRRRWRKAARSRASTR